MTTITKDIAPVELGKDVMNRMAVVRLRELIYVLHDTDSFGSYLLGMALNHFEDKASVPHLLNSLFPVSKSGGEVK